MIKRASGLQNLCYMRAHLEHITYFIKGRQGGRIARTHLYTIRFFNTLQLRLFEEHKNGVDPAGARHSATQ